MVKRKKREAAQVYKAQKDLAGWKLSMDLMLAVVEYMKPLSQGTSQLLALEMQKCAVTLPGKISEVYSKNHARNKIELLNIARSSLNELRKQTEEAEDLKYLSAKKSKELNTQVDKIWKSIDSQISELAEQEIIARKERPKLDRLTRLRERQAAMQS